MQLVDISESQRREIQRLELCILQEIDRICRKHSIKYSVAYGTLIGAVRHNGFIPWDDDIDICLKREDYIRLKEVCKYELSSEFFYQSNDTDPEYYYLFDKIRLNNTIFKESFVAKYNIHHGIYVDIFPIDRIPDNPSLRERQFKKFHFYRTGVQSKYLDVRARSGKKKYGAMLMRMLYCILPLSYLYRKAIETATMYNNEKTEKSMCFFSPYKKKDIFDSSLYEHCIDHKFENENVLIYEQYDKMLSQLYGNYMQAPPIDKRVSVHTVVDLRI